MRHHPKLEMSRRPDKGSNQHSRKQLEQKCARMTEPPAEGKCLGKERGEVGEAGSLAVRLTPYSPIPHTNRTNLFREWGQGGEWKYYFRQGVRQSRQHCGVVSGEPRAEETVPSRSSRVWEPAPRVPGP